MDYFKKYLKYKKNYMILKSLTQKGSGDHEESEKNMIFKKTYWE